MGVDWNLIGPVLQQGGRRSRWGACPELGEFAVLNKGKCLLKIFTFWNQSSTQFYSSILECSNLIQFLT